MSFIEAKGLWKEYGNNIVLENVNVRVEEGEFITIVGTSGCGKTTFLKMLLGIETPSRGAMLLSGKPLKDEPDPERGIVFQKYSVFPHLTTLENVMIAQELPAAPITGRLFGTARRKARQEAEEILKSVGLSAALDKFPAELSGGMQQRLAIAQSLINHPKILLLDEPFGALDPGIRADMHQLIKELWRKTGITIFMITHDLKEGFYLGTRLWVFDKVRDDPHDPDSYGAKITYDIPVGTCDESTLQQIDEAIDNSNPHGPDETPATDTESPNLEAV